MACNGDSSVTAKPVIPHANVCLKDVSAPEVAVKKAIQIEAQQDIPMDAVHCTEIIKQEFEGDIGCLDEATWSYHASVPEEMVNSTVQLTDKTNMKNTQPTNPWTNLEKVPIKINNQNYLLDDDVYSADGHTDLAETSEVPFTRNSFDSRFLSGEEEELTENSKSSGYSQISKESNSKDRKHKNNSQLEIISHDCHIGDKYFKCDAKVHAKRHKKSESYKRNHYDANFWSSDQQNPHQNRPLREETQRIQNTTTTIISPLSTNIRTSNHLSNRYGSEKDIADLKRLLKSWNIEDVFDFFCHQQLYVGILKKLTHKMAENVFERSNISLGVRVEFLYQWSLWKKSFNEAVQTAPDNALKLHSILESNVYGKHIKGMIEKAPCLDKNGRKLLCESILHYCIENDHSLSVQDAENLTKQIVAAFPGEDPGYYYVHRKGAAPLGKLYQKYRNWKNSVCRKAKLDCETASKMQKTDIKKEL